MHFGVTVAYGAGAGAALPDYAAGAARIAEELGFESIWAGEHVVVPVGYRSRHPYSPEGRMPHPVDTDFPDPLVWLTFVAAATERLRVCTGVLVLPQRHPVVLAKEAATLDRLSGGRLVLGVGIGWMREEAEACGADFDERAPRTDEFIAALRCLWSEEEATFEGRWTRFERARCHPKPTQASGVPIVVGGHSPAAARRAGRLGDGLYAVVASPEEVPPLGAEMRRAAIAAGRDPDALEITTMLPAYEDAPGTDLRGLVGRYEDAGVDRLVVARLFDFDLEVLERNLEAFVTAAAP